MIIVESTNNNREKEMVMAIPLEYTMEPAAMRAALTIILVL